MIHIVTTDGSCLSLQGQSFDKKCEFLVSTMVTIVPIILFKLWRSLLSCKQNARVWRQNRFEPRCLQQSESCLTNSYDVDQHDSTIFAIYEYQCLFDLFNHVQFFSAIYFPEILWERLRQQRRHLQKSKKNSKHAKSTAENLGSQFLHHTYMLCSLHGLATCA